MGLLDIEFVSSAVYPEQYPEDDKPEIALVGRSNVGKSSFINAVMNRKGIAKTSSTPGKTRTINFYIIDKSFYFTDLPGYGYAQVSKTEKEKWGKIIETYLTTRKQLKHVFQIIDVRHNPTKDDVLMNEWLVYNKIPITIIATKIDKISRGKWNKHLNIIRRDLSISGKIGLVHFSSETGTGKEEITNIIQDIVF